MNFNAVAKRTAQLIIFIACCSFVVLFASCSAKIAEWRTDYDSALAVAKEQGKPVFLVFTGMDWDGSSKDFVDSILLQNAFLKKAGDSILVHIDFPESDDTEITEALMKNYSLAENLSVQMLPALFVQHNSGYVIEEIPFNPDELSSPKALLQKTKPAIKKNKQITTAYTKMEKAEGPAKVTLIAEIDKLTSQAHRHLLTDLIAEVPTLDPENKSGFLGKYTLMLTYPDAMEAFHSQDVDGAVAMFTDLVDSGLLSSDEIQEAYYSAAYLHAMSGSSTNDIVLEFLQKSYDAKPDSENAANIQMTMDQLKKMAAQESGETAN